MAAAVGFLSASSSTVGGMLSQRASQSAAARAERIGRMNERDFERRAIDTAERAAEDKRRLYWQASKLTGSQRAAYGAANVNAEFGSAALVRSETEYIIERDAATIALNADKEIEDFIFAGKIAAMGGQAQAAGLRSQGLGALISGVASGASTLVNSASYSSRGA